MLIIFGSVLGMHRSDTQYRYRLRYGHFLPDRVSIRWDRSKSDIVRILFCVIVKPHERHKNIIKHHKVFVHNIPSVLKLFHSLMWGRDEYLSQVQVNSSLRCVCLSSSVQHSDCVPRSVTTVKTVRTLCAALYWNLSYYNTFKSTMKDY